MLLFIVWVGQVGCMLICYCLCCVLRVFFGRFRLLMVVWILFLLKFFSVCIGMNKVVCMFGVRLIGCGCWLSSFSNLLVVSVIFSVCGWLVRLLMFSISCEIFFFVRKCGIFSLVIIGVVIMILFLLWLKLFVVYVCVIICSLLLKLLIGSVMIFLFCLLSVIGCVCCVMILIWFIGGFLLCLRLLLLLLKCNVVSCFCFLMIWL